MMIKIICQSVFSLSSFRTGNQEEVERSVFRFGIKIQEWCASTTLMTRRLTVYSKEKQPRQEFIERVSNIKYLTSRHLIMMRMHRNF
jgi:hypothetical protein